MPTPGYILCAGSGSLDQFTNVASFFNVIESVPIKIVQAEQELAIPAKPLSMRLCATWLKDPEDAPNQQFEAQFVGLFPGLNAEAILAIFPAFTFTDPLHRLFVPEITIPGFFAPGNLTILCRIRRVGDMEWMASQRYVILLLEQNDLAPLPPD